MLLQRIFKIFFSAAVVLLLPELYAEINLTARYSLEKEFSGGEDAEFLRSALRRIDQWARAADIKRPRRRVCFRINAEKIELYAGKKQFLVRLPGTSVEWKNSFEMRQRLFSVLFWLRTELDSQQFRRVGKLPVWMTAAVDEAMARRQESEQYFSLNRDFLALQMLVRCSGKLPDFAALCRFESLPADPASRQIFAQMSRLLVLSALKLKLLNPMLEDHFHGRSADHWVNRFSGNTEAQIQISDLAANILWSFRSPPPAALSKKHFAALQTVVLPELDKRQTPTGNMISLSFADANKFLMETERPDLRNVRSYYARQWNIAGRNHSAAVQMLCRKLGECAGKIGSDRDIAAEFSALTLKLYQQLDKEEQIINGFIGHCFAVLPLDQLYSLQAETSRYSGDNAGTAAVEEILKKAEKDYLKNY